MPVEELIEEAPVEEIVETPEVEEEPAEEPAAEPVEGELSEEAEEPSDEEEPEDQQQGKVEDNRKMPAALKGAIAEVKKNNPEAAKEIQRLYWANKEFSAIFPKPEEAVAAKTLLEEIGGQDGIHAIAEERAEWSKLDEDYSKGSPEFVDAIYANNKEAFDKMAGHVVNKWATSDPKTYGYFRDSVSYNTLLQQPGVEAGLQDLAQLHGQLAQYPQFQRAIESVVNGVVGIRERAQQFQQERAQRNPEREKLDADKRQFETERRGSFEQGIATQAADYLQSHMQPALDAVVNGRTVDPEAMKGYQRMVREEVERRFAEIPDIEGKISRHYATGDAKAATEWIQRQYDRFLPEAAKVIEPFLRNISPARSKAVPAGSGKPSASAKAEPGSVVLREMPDEKDVDWSKTTMGEFITGKAVLTNGKRASGWA